MLLTLLQTPISSLTGSDAAIARALLAAQDLILTPGTPYYTSSDPVTLYAVWEPVTYKVNFAGDQIRYKPLPPRRMSSLRPLQPR